jgi:hypothetical protein
MPAMTQRLLLGILWLLCSGCDKVLLKLGFNSGQSVDFGAWKAEAVGDLKATENGLSGKFMVNAPKASFEIAFTNLKVTKGSASAVEVYNSLDNVTLALGRYNRGGNWPVVDVKCEDGRPSAEIRSDYFERMTLTNLRPEHAPGLACEPASSGGGVLGSCLRNTKDECSELLDGDVAAFESTCEKAGNTFGSGPCSISFVVQCKDAVTTSGGSSNRTQFYWTSAACTRISPERACTESLSGTPVGKCP